MSRRRSPASAYTQHPFGHRLRQRAHPPQIAFATARSQPQPRSDNVAKRIAPASPAPPSSQNTHDWPRPHQIVGCLSQPYWQAGEGWLSNSAPATRRIQIRDVAVPNIGSSAHRDPGKGNRSDSGWHSADGFDSCWLIATCPYPISWICKRSAR